MTKPQVSVIVVNYNTYHLTKKCLESVYKFTKEVDLEVILVDNHSTDNSVSLLEKQFPHVVFIKNKENLGFAKANNQGFKRAQGDYLFLLNSDAYLVENSIKKLLFKIQAGRYVVVAPMIVNSDYSLQQSHGSFPTFLSTLVWMFFIDDLPLVSKFVKSFHARNKYFYKSERLVDWVSGSSFMAEKKAVVKAGLFDQSIFMYGEDVELCYRIWKNGGEILYSPTTKIVHLGSGGQKGFVEKPLVFEISALKYFYQKHFPKRWTQERIIIKIGTALRAVLFGLILRRRDAFQIYVKAFKVV